MTLVTYGMTPLMRDCLLVIQELSADGVPPSYTEIARELDLKSKSGVHRLVSSLTSRGHLARLPHRRRSLAVRVPLPMPPDAPIELTAAGAKAVAGARILL